MTQVVEMAREQDLVTQARSPQAGLARGAQEALYQEYGGRVFAFLARLLGDRSAAEDLLQETFVRAFRHLPQQDPRRSFKGWVFRIARNAALDHLHAQEKARRAFSQKERSEPEDPGKAAAREEALAGAKVALATLSGEDRALLIKRHGLGLKLTELSEALACTERTVRNRLDRAAERLTEAVLASRRRDS